MINLNDYIYINEVKNSINDESIDESKIGHALKKFWKWLIGSKKDMSHINTYHNFSFNNKEGETVKLHKEKVSKMQSASYDEVRQIIEEVSRKEKEDDNKFHVLEHYFTNKWGKGNNGFPYVKKNDSKFGIILYEKTAPIGIICYALAQSLESKKEEKESEKPEKKEVNSYRKAIDDLDHNNYGHIFLLEVLKPFRDNGIGEQLINTVMGIMKKKGNEGVTIHASDEKILEAYRKSKYNFNLYNTTRRLLEKKF